MITQPCHGAQIGQYGVMRQQRLVFGEVAELYDKARAAYPDALIDDVIGFAGADGAGLRALGVGAGTGKATVGFAARGLEILALEPSAAMAAVAMRNCQQFPGVRIEPASFEGWPAEPGGFGLLYSAQAWHWVQPEGGRGSGPRRHARPVLASHPMAGGAAAGRAGEPLPPPRARPARQAARLSRLGLPQDRWRGGRGDPGDGAVHRRDRAHLSLARHVHRRFVHRPAADPVGPPHALRGYQD